MDYDDYLKQNPEFARRLAKGDFKKSIPVKSYSGLTILKFALLAIFAGLFALIINSIIFFGSGELSFATFLIAESVALISSVFAIGYIIALGVYMGVNSK